MENKNVFLKSNFSQSYDTKHSSLGFNSSQAPHYSHVSRTSWWSASGFVSESSGACSDCYVDHVIG